MKRAYGLLVRCFAPGLRAMASLALLACDNPGVSSTQAPAQVSSDAPAINATPATATSASTHEAALPPPPPPAAGASAPITAAMPAAAGAAAPAVDVSPAGPMMAMSDAAAAAPPAAAEPKPIASLTITVPQVEPGAEDTQCVQIRLSNTEPLDIVSLHNKLTTGSHHFIVTALNDHAAPEQPLTRCQGFGGAVTGAPLTITQAHDDHVQLPDGLGYRLDPGHVIHLEMHYINTTDRALDISATTDMFAAPAGAQLQPAAVMLIGTADITVPAHSTAETGPKFLQLPAGMEDTKFFQITGHTHSYGTDVSVRLASALQEPLMDLYTPANFNWEAPESKPLTPNVSVPQGGGFLLNCAWNNTSDSELKWGESALQEMCFFWGYYYPRKDVFSIVIDDIDQDLLKEIAARPPADPMTTP